ncbi:MAG: XRE family transcriptional regulator, partial [Bacilli bacterium]
IETIAAHHDGEEWTEEELEEIERFKEFVKMKRQKKETQ